jgi:hypothetical protein
MSAGLHAMDEALEMAAAVIQFIEIEFYLYPKLDRLYSDICNAPQIIRNFYADLRQQLDCSKYLC